MNISKFTQKSQEVVQGCEKIAMDYGHQEMGEEHLLASMMKVDAVSYTQLTLPTTPYV